MRKYYRKEKKNMFGARFISVDKGVSKNGNEWFRVSLIADTNVPGKCAILQGFCTEQAYNHGLLLPSDSRCKVACCVNEKGYIVINAIKGEQ